MSLVDTIGPIIFLAFLGLAFVIGACAIGYRMYEAGRLDHDRQRLITQNRSLIRDLVAEVGSNPSLAECMPDELQKRLIDAHDQFNNPRRELVA